MSFGEDCQPSENEFSEMRKPGIQEKRSRIGSFLAGNAHPAFSSKNDLIFSSDYGLLNALQIWERRKDYAEIKCRIGKGKRFGNGCHSFDSGGRFGVG
jgi:hypothetical protein